MQLSSTLFSTANFLGFRSGIYYLPGKASHARNFPPPLKKTHSMLPPPSVIRTRAFQPLLTTTTISPSFFLGLENPLLFLLFYAKPMVGLGCIQKALSSLLCGVHTHTRRRRRRRRRKEEEYRHTPCSKTCVPQIITSHFSFSKTFIFVVRRTAGVSGVPSGGEREENSRILDPYGGRWLLLDLLSTFTPPQITF